MLPLKSHWLKNFGSDLSEILIEGVKLMLNKVLEAWRRYLLPFLSLTLQDIRSLGKMGWLLIQTKIGKESHQLLGIGSGLGLPECGITILWPVILHVIVFLPKWSIPSCIPLVNGMLYFFRCFICLYYVSSSPRSYVSQ